MDEELPLAKKYDAYMIGLLWGREGMPRDANERGMIAAELMYKADEMGIPNEDIWFDPIVTPAVNVDTKMEAITASFIGLSVIS
ncbi:unnamed protein product [marine sediment metagenome]|uniref:Pterin-binding domain-containing protein n=1 Tax=marine sediment metagenome TaxID=412755 RepID=X1V5F9_9ZZZZ